MDKNILVETFDKLDGNNITNIVVGFFAACILGYACYNNASLEISLSEKKVTLNGRGK